MENLSEFNALLASPKNVVVTTHFKPDADALGSSLGLAGYLKKKGHSVQVITPSDYPDFLAWMPGNDSVLAFSADKPAIAEKVRKHIADADVIFCLDFSSLSRIYDLTEPVKGSKAVKVMVDHHLEPENFAAFTQWDVTAASTAQLVYRLICEVGDKQVIDENIASCLYAGLMTDTGGFRHNNTRRDEFLIAAELVALGANPSKISRLVYETNSVERLRLMGFVLQEKLVVLPEYNTAYITITDDELKRFGSQTGDTEGLVNYALSVKNVRMAALMYKRKNDVKLSFRSLEDFSVSELARTHFEGGGHKNAAGGQSALSLEQTLEKFLSLLPYYKEQLTRTI
ncbi:MAG: bifunctional oligoribonuclease/PAP phosphatase NrnA [Cyclobacteriaceae bacterium]|jgi:phosphoesterase RecJ-like protein|nr:bifunctional oligoribonuclease/PAP phosphatase NrnA [Cyclobacteriaceae bacterium]